MMAGLARHLGEDRACVLTGVGTDTSRHTELDERVPVYRRRLPFAPGRIQQALGLGFSLTEVWLRERPAAIQAATVFDAYLALRLQGVLRIPYLVYAHGNEILSLRDDETWEGHHRALRSADAVVANSRFTAELARKAGVSGREIHVVHPGCDTDEFASRAADPETARRIGLEPGDGPIVLSVGTLVRRKGHDTVIRCLKRLRSSFPKIKYLIVGSGRETDRLVEIAEAYGVRDSVRFVGHVPDDELPKFYNLSDVFVMVSRTRQDANDVEGFGIVYLEANACEVPVVGGRSGGVADAIVDGTTGFLVDPTDPEQVATAISRILSDQDLARRMGRAGRERVVEHFRWAKVADTIHDIAMSLA